MAEAEEEGDAVRLWEKVCVIVFSVAIGAFLIVAACVHQAWEPAPPAKSGTSFGESLNVRRIEFEGHTYIVVRGIHKLAITHDPDCPCRKKR